MKVKEIIKITKGELLSGSPEADIDPSRISTDSRTISRGGFFIALDGPNFDGNDFVKDAFGKGAGGVLVKRLIARPIDPTKIIIKVRDTTKALQDIAASHRKDYNIPVIAVTGSNGKTTAKEMVWRILSARYKVLKNEGTKNNHIGVPQTLLKLNRRHDICVLELGMNHKGEIKLLGDMVKPTIAVITNIGPSHLEFLEGLDGVCEAKKEILGSLDKRKGVAILNGDDEFLSRVKAKGFKVFRFGFNETNDFKASEVIVGKNKLKFMLNDADRFQLNLLGMHNIYNALAAIAVASQFKINPRLMKKALFNYKPSYMRLNIRRMNGIDIINDSYNSNPSSMARALEALKYYPARTRWVVSGDMMELGRQAAYFHKIIGHDVARSNVEGLLTFGKLSRYTLSQAKESGMKKGRLWHCSTHAEIANILRRVAKRGDVVLLKGSRAMKMEEVLNKL